MDRFLIPGLKLAASGPCEIRHSDHESAFTCGCQSCFDRRVRGHPSVVLENQSLRIFSKMSNDKERNTASSR